MRRSAPVIVAIGLATAAWTGSASAQGVGVDLYVGPTYDRYYYDAPAYSDYRYGPRVYGYYYENGERHLRQPEEYRTGSKRWWKQMDRTGRGGHQE